VADDSDTWAESRRYNSVYGRFSNSLPEGILFEYFLVRKVLDYLGRHEARFVTDLCEYLRFPSVSAQSTQGQDMIRFAEWLVRHCAGIGLHARRCPTAGHPVVLARLRRTGARRPRYLIYGHYDVQPPDPLELWQSPPFEPRIAGRLSYARGSSDSKGEHFAHLKAVKAYLKTGAELPCDLTFVIDGEEEVGNQSLQEFLEKNRKSLGFEGVVISDTGMPGLKYPALTGVQAGSGCRRVVARPGVTRGEPAVSERELQPRCFCGGDSDERPAMAGIGQHPGKGAVGKAVSRSGLYRSGRWAKRLDGMP
jgi:hypothetical protein